MSTFIDLPMDFNEVNEPQPVKEGTYDLVITDVKEKLVNEGGPLKGLLVICEIIGHEDAANVLHNLSLPVVDDDSEKVKTKMLFIKRFLHAFGIQMKGSGFNPADFIGKKAKVQLKLDEYEGQLSNKIVLPMIR